MFTSRFSKKGVVMGVVFLIHLQIYSMQEAVDTAVSAVHYFCPRCWWNPDRHLADFKQAIERNDAVVINFLLGRRNVSPHEILDGVVLPLVYAAQLAREDAMHALLNHGAAPDSQLNDFSPIKYPSALIALCAQENLSSEQVVRCVRLLLNFGANPRLVSSLPTKSELDAVMAAARKNKGTMSDGLSVASSALLKNMSLREDRTAYDFACKNGYKEAADILKTAMNSQGA